MKRALAALLGLACLACPAPRSQVEGVVTYRERVALPATGVEVEVRLVDDSDLGGTVESVLLRDPGQVPIPFRISYRQYEVEAGRRYVVDATIRVDGRTEWVTREPVPVVTGGAPARGVEVVVGQP